MSNHDWMDDLTAYIDGELPPERCRALEAELKTNAPLQAMERRLRATLTQVATLQNSGPVPSAALRAKVLENIATPTFVERLRRALTPPRLASFALATACAAAALVVVSRGARNDFTPDEANVLLAMNLELGEDFELLGLDSSDDIALVAQLEQLEQVP